MSEQPVNVGDWVCWMKNGELVIGEVRYIRGRPITTWEKQAITSCGVVDVQNILEVRSAGLSCEKEKAYSTKLLDVCSRMAFALWSASTLSQARENFTRVLSEAGLNIPTQEI